MLATPGGSAGSEVRQLMRSVPQTPKRAMLYARVSTDEQARSGYSLTQQLDALRAYVKAEGYEIVEEISDPGESGAYLEHHEATEAFDAARAKSMESDTFESIEEIPSVPDESTRTRRRSSVRGP